MASTPNYNLKKVEYTEIADIPGHFNANFDTIDTVMKNNADAAVAAEDNAKSYASGLIGTLSNLLTTAKNNIVVAVNEIFGKVEDVEDDLLAHKADYASDVDARLNGAYKVGKKFFNVCITPGKNTSTDAFKVVTDIQQIGGILIRVTGQENTGKPIMFLIRIADNFSLCKYSSINQETPEIKISKENNNVVLWFNHVGHYITYTFDVLYSAIPYSNTTQWEVFEVEPSQIPAEAVSIPLYE